MLLLFYPGARPHDGSSGGKKEGHSECPQISSTVRVTLATCCPLFQAAAAATEKQRTAQFWQQRMAEIEAVDPENTDWATPELPLARVKKVMKV